jgi:farnesyl diphosphate synthase
MTADPLAAFRARFAPAIEAALTRTLGELPAGRLRDAMAHAVRAGGKRLRPLLCLAAHEAAGGDPAALTGPACALELLHTYSLVHDDLPAMDDDDLRRGQPTVHKAFDEAAAILAGDALHTLAFEVMAREPAGEARAARRAAAALRLALASGASGLALGPMLGREAEGRPGGTLASLTALHRLKTGALIQAAAAIGAIHAGADAATLRQLDEYGAATGLAFQIADDLLDVTADSATLGKTAGKDLAQDKLTFVKLLGLEGARAAARAERDKALAALAAARLGDTAVLAAIADYAVSRKN